MAHTEAEGEASLATELATMLKLCFSVEPSLSLSDRSDNSTSYPKVLTVKFDCILDSGREDRGVAVKLLELAFGMAVDIGNCRLFTVLSAALGRCLLQYLLQLGLQA